MSKKPTEEYTRETYPTGWVRSPEPLTDEELEQIQERQRRMLDRSMRQVK